ncbi:MAG: ketoacyl-ACP synthase III [Prevotellaceae bacterium]|jgi:3-oxoacyl-[acyl-carrier-protein] synthase-3|nr:ketoacyl-ACP synthase III [Prevotellaceae bacterium]
MNCKIEAIEYYLPEKVITNQYLHEYCGIDADFLENKIGIKKRHTALESEASSDLAVKAGELLVEKNNVKREDIELLLLCTQHGDYKLPTTACIVQNRLGLPNSCASFDINLGCSGFVYALGIAGNFIKTGRMKKVLIITADVYSKSINYTDKNTASLFGDAGSAILLTASGNESNIEDIVYGTDGSNYDKLIIYNSGIKKDAEKSDYLYMNGREIFKFSTRVVPASINELLGRNNLQKSDIKYFIFHQANKYMLTEIKNRMELTDEQLVIDMEDYGNTVSSTIPIVYKNLLSAGRLTKGDRIVFCGFGVGLSWASCLYIV